MSNNTPCESSDLLSVNGKIDLNEWASELGSANVHINPSDVFSTSYLENQKDPEEHKRLDAKIKEFLRKEQRINISPIHIGVIYPPYLMRLENKVKSYVSLFPVPKSFENIELDEYSLVQLIEYFLPALRIPLLLSSDHICIFLASVLSLHLNTVQSSWTNMGIFLKNLLLLFYEINSKDPMSEETKYFLSSIYLMLISSEYREEIKRGYSLQEFMNGYDYIEKLKEGFLFKKEIPSRLNPDE